MNVNVYVRTFAILCVEVWGVVSGKSHVTAVSMLLSDRIGIGSIRQDLDLDLDGSHGQWKRERRRRRDLAFVGNKQTTLLFSVFGVDSILMMIENGGLTIKIESSHCINIHNIKVESWHGHGQVRFRLG